LHYSLEASVPFIPGFNKVIDSPGVVMETLPTATVIEPAVACRRDKLVGRKFIQYMSVAYTPIGMFEGSENSPDYIHLGIIIIVGAHLVVKSLVKVGATSQD